MKYLQEKPQVFDNSITLLNEPWLKEDRNRFLGDEHTTYHNARDATRSIVGQTFITLNT